MGDRDELSIAEELAFCRDFDTSPDVADSFNTPGGNGRLKFSGIGAKQLAAFLGIETEWIVTDVFARDEVAVLGARSKCCKTLSLSDLAVALASGTKWMGEFVVPRRLRVLFVSGEANYPRMSNQINNACKVRKIELPNLEGFIHVECLEFPKLPSELDRQRISLLVREYSIDVVIIDPLYRGIVGVDGASLAAMGDAIKGFQAACSPATLILSHHVTKASAREVGGPPNLEDLAGAGLAESAGQWWLIGRNEEYQDDLKHNLCVRYGGREGQSGRKQILFDEKEWKIDVQDLSKYQEGVKENRSMQRNSENTAIKAKAMEQACSFVESYFREAKVPHSKAYVESLALDSGVAQKAYRDAHNQLADAGKLIEVKHNGWAWHENAAELTSIKPKKAHVATRKKSRAGKSSSPSP